MRNLLARESDLARCAHLESAWADAQHPRSRSLRQWLREGRARGSVYQPLDGSPPFGVGFAGFARGRTVTAWLAAPDGGLYEYLCDSQAGGQAPLLDEAGILEARADGDLHALVFVHRLLTTDPADPRAQEAYRIGADAYRLLLGGWGISAVWHDFDVRDEAAASAGGLKLVARTVSRVRAGLRRSDLNPSFPASLAASLFVDLPRRLALTVAQRRVAELALWRLDDEAIATALAISPETVRRHWRDIYQRMDDRLAGPGWPPPTRADPHRGPDRRRHALEHLMVHLDELRP